METFRNWGAQAAAWVAVVFGGISVQVWIALAGLAISAFMAVTNYRHKKLEERLAKERSEREAAEEARRRELHELKTARLRAGLPVYGGE